MRIASRPAAGNGSTMPETRRQAVEDGSMIRQESDRAQGRYPKFGWKSNSPGGQLTARQVPRPHGALCLSVLAWLLVSSLGASRAGDWPQILGPERNGVARTETLSDRFPSGRLRPRFELPLGSGFAGPAVTGKTVVVFHRQDQREILEAFHADTGAQLWRTDFPAEYQGGYNPDSGPRCVPVIHAGRVYALGAGGRLHCVALENGRPMWSRELARDYEAPEGYFGIGSTPLVADDKLLVNIGGRGGAGVVALALDTGKTIWKATDEQVSYSSPVLANLRGMPHALFLTRLSLISLDPGTGQTRFSHPFGQRGLTVTGTMPVVFDNRVFLSASYNIGAEVVEVSDEGQIRSLWKNDETLSSQYASAVFHEGHLYGSHGREDSPQRAELRCVEAATGRVRWSRPNVGMAHLILVPPKLLVLEVQSGDLALVRATPQAYTELDRREITNDVVRCLPALSEGTLYVRANQEGGNRSRLFALPLK
jgi:outer membrane protein assembly factor BamB